MAEDTDPPNLSALFFNFSSVWMLWKQPQRQVDSTLACYTLPHSRTEREDLANGLGVKVWRSYWVPRCKGSHYKWFTVLVWWQIAHRNLSRECSIRTADCHRQTSPEIAWRSAFPNCIHPVNCSTKCNQDKKLWHFSASGPAVYNLCRSNIQLWHVYTYVGL